MQHDLPSEAKCFLATQDTLEIYGTRSVISIKLYGIGLRLRYVIYIRLHDVNFRLHEVIFFSLYGVITI
jgi:hypothetical protein